MEISKRVSNGNLYPQPEKMKNPGTFQVFHLQGVSDFKYYTDGKAHGFLNQERIITDARYTGLHEGFAVKGIGKYAIGYLNDAERRPNKFELINLISGNPVLTCGCYIKGERYLAFRKDSETGDIQEHRWGILDMLTDRLVAQPTIHSSRIRKMLNTYEADYAENPTLFEEICEYSETLIQNENSVTILS